MKKIPIYLRALPLVALLAFTGCDREKDVTPSTPACKPVKQTIHTIGGTDPDTRITIEYNVQEKPVRFTVQTDGFPDQYNLLEYNDTGRLSKLTAYDLNGKVLSYQVYEYNQAGQLITSAYQDANSNISSSSTHAYDGTGNRVKTTSTSTESGTEQINSTTYEYSGGNLVRSIQSGGPMSGAVTVYEYYTDRENQLRTHEETLPDVFSNRNMLKKRTQTYPDSFDGFIHTSEYTYEYNNKGFPTKSVSMSKNNQSSGTYTYETSYEYQCR